MNVASLELCRELYELSGWGDEIPWQDWLVWGDDSTAFKGLVPPYDLGYLLRKLSTGTEIYRLEKQYGAARHSIKNSRQLADTPEDATCKLAIELFKQGILTK